MGGVVAQPSLSHAQFCSQLMHVFLASSSPVGMSKQDRVVIAENLVRPGVACTAAKHYKRPASFFRRAKFQVIGLVQRLVSIENRMADLCCGRDAAAGETTRHVLLVAHRDLKFVQVERNGNGPKSSRSTNSCSLSGSQAFQPPFQCVFAQAAMAACTSSWFRQASDSTHQACLASNLSVWINGMGDRRERDVRDQSGLGLPQPQCLLQVGIGSPPVMRCGRFHGSAFLITSSRVQHVR